MIVGLAFIIWILTSLKLQPITKHLELKSEKTAIAHLWHTIKQRNYRIGFLLTALLSLGGFMMMPWGSAFAVNNLNITYEQLPVLFMVSGIAALIIMPVIGRLSDKIPKVKIFTVAAVLHDGYRCDLHQPHSCSFRDSIAFEYPDDGGHHEQNSPGYGACIRLAKNAGSWSIHEHQFILAANRGRYSSGCGRINSSSGITNKSIAAL